MMRIVTAVTGAVLVAMFLMPGASVQAQTAPARIHLVQAAQPDAVDPSAPRRRVRRVPIYPRYQGEPDGVYPRYYPGRNAVRDCTATYVQENRPSGTVIVPRMNCYWRPG